MKIAILIPCYNEALTIGKVVRDFKRALPEADIYVYDNNSTDDSIVLAQDAQAIVRSEYRQGKGNVIRSMFKDVQADYYIMVDGDDTYPAEAARDLLNLAIAKNADMVCGDRLSNGTYAQENKRGFHELGNNLVKGLVNWIFKSKLNDIMTGYRVFSDVFVKNFPVMSSGFQIETEMTAFALNYQYTVLEYPIEYRDRPEGSVSKLNTFQDGYRVLKLIIQLFKHSRPLLFFSLITLALVVMSFIAGLPVIIEYLSTRYVSHVPLAILASGIMVLAAITYMVGLILETLVYYKKMDFELHRLQYRKNHHD